MALSKEKRICQKLLPYCIAGIFTTITLLIMIYTLKIYPFGDKTYLWTDSDQYLGLESYFGSLLGKNDIFYSWGNALGGNALSELAYYSFSPFNVIFIIFHDHMLLAAHLVVYSKIIVSSLTFCYCQLNIYDKKNILMKALLSTSYAFMGYMIFYGWNTSWMDGVILLPIIYVGIKKIIDGKSILQYVLSLAAVVIANFYVGFMLCIASFIFYMVQLVLADGEFIEKIKRTFVKYMFASFVGVGISAFLLIPTYLGLPSGRHLSVRNIIKNMSLNIKTVEILSGLFTGQNNNLNDNAPLIYVGIVVVVLDILFFVSKRVTLKKKAVFSSLILIFFISFENSFINQIWHGLSQNHWFNYRYSFIFSFVLLIIACEACEILKEKMPPKEDVFKAVLILGIILAVVMEKASDKINGQGIFLDVFVVVIFVMTVILKNLYVRKILMVILSCSVIFSLVCNGCFSPKDYHTQPKSTYETIEARVKNATKKINDDSFYRMEKTFSLGRCDGNFFDYRGIANYASTENVENLKFLKKLGAMHSSVWTQYTANLPIATEALLGVKYILTNEMNEKGYEIIGEDGDIVYLKNRYALPVVFPVNNLENYNLKELNDFELLNQIWKSVNGLKDNVFESCIVTDSSHEGENRLNVMVENPGPLYAMIRPGRYTSIKVNGDGFEKNIDYNKSSEIYYIGEFDKGDVLSISFEINDGKFDSNKIACYVENKDIIYDNSCLVKEQNISIEEVSSSDLVMLYAGEKDSIATTIPYDNGWTVYDNGRKIATEKNWNNFLAFQLDDAKEHKIELIYRPIGFDVGVKITILSIALLIIFEVLNSNSKKKCIKRKDE